MSTTARELVARRLGRRAQAFPDVDLAPLDASGLDRRDAALAAAIDHAVARRWLTLAAILEHAAARPWAEIEPRLQGILLSGAAQILLLERVPSHAAIDESVTIARRLVRAGAGGFVNAILRRVDALRGAIVDRFDVDARDHLPLGDGRAWRLAEEIFSADPLERLAAQTSHPRALLDRWHARLGGPRTAALALHGIVAAPIMIAGLPDPAPEACIPAEAPGFHVFTGERAVLDAILAKHPGARVQDPGTAAPVERTRGLAVKLVVDACAGRGTKTLQLAALHPNAQVVAAERDPGRLRALRAAAGDRVEVVEFGALPRFAGRADLLVLDVPCSNTGVLARRVEAKYRFGSESLRSLVGVQRQIVADTLALLREDGHLLYATCSLEPEENEEQAAWIARWHRMSIVASESRLPRGAPGDPPAGYADGSFLAILRR
jgi:16S rRNA (cytosine967-C5)-methyltransferase